MIKAIIFDIGGVVYLGKMEDSFSKLNFLLGLKEGSINDLFLRNREPLLIGKITSKEFYILVTHTFSLNFSSKEVHDLWIRAWAETSGLNKELVTLIKKLKTKYKVACISDATSFDVELDNKTGIKELFKPYVNSCDFGMTKSNPKLFGLVLKKLNVNPKECIFIDDRPKHFGIPKELGAKTIPFENNLQLFKELRELGVII